MEKFIREVPKARVLKAEIDRLVSLGFIIKDKGESIEVWAEESLT